MTFVIVADRSGTHRGMAARELADRMGHSKASMSLDVYTHAMPPDEAGSERVLALVRA